MDYRYVCIVLCSVLCTALCDTQKMDQIQVQKTIENASALPESTTFHRKARGMNVIYAQMISCAMTYDTVCFLDAAEDYLEVTKNDLLAQADQDALRATGRADPDNTPSHITKVIAKMLKELTGLWNNGLSSFFMGGREAGDEDEEEDEEEESSAVAKSDQNGSSRDSNGVQSRGSTLRKKKKKKPGTIHRLLFTLKLATIGAMLYLKIHLLIKTLTTVLKFKYFFLALSALLVHTFKLWSILKDKKPHEKVIYYEHAHHDHHYEDHGDVEIEPSGWHDGHDEHGDHGTHWDRYDLSGGTSAQDMAYSSQKPTPSSIYSLLG